MQRQNDTIVPLQVISFPCFHFTSDACSTVAIHQRHGRQDFEGNCGARNSEKHAEFSELHSL